MFKVEIFFEFLENGFRNLEARAKVIDLVQGPDIEGLFKVSVGSCGVGSFVSLHGIIP